MSNRHIEIKLDPRGLGSIEIDGHNVSHLIHDTEIKTSAGAPTEIVLRVAHGVTFDMAAAVSDLRLEGDCPHCGQTMQVTAK